MFFVIPFDIRVHFLKMCMFPFSFFVYIFCLAPSRLYFFLSFSLTLFFAPSFSYFSICTPQAALVDGFNSISIDTWLDVIPQLIARIHTPAPPIRRLIHELLTRVGRAHPQVCISICI
jgi:hypothetical protein